MFKNTMFVLFYVLGLSFCAYGMEKVNNENQELSPFNITLYNGTMNQTKIIFSKNYPKLDGRVEVILQPLTSLFIGKIRVDSDITVLNYGQSVGQLNSALNDSNTATYSRLSEVGGESNVVFISWNTIFSPISLSSKIDPQLPHFARSSFPKLALNVDKNGMDLKAIFEEMHDIFEKKMEEPEILELAEYRMKNIPNINYPEMCRYLLGLPEFQLDSHIRLMQAKVKIENLYLFQLESRHLEPSKLNYNPSEKLIKDLLDLAYEGLMVHHYGKRINTSGDI